MPRTARNVVEYTVDGEALRATFRHRHAAELKDGKRNWLRGTKGEKLLHITQCFLAPQSVKVPQGLAVNIVALKQGEMAFGRARCSKRDEYNWKKGIKLAFHRALLQRYPQPEIANTKCGMCEGTGRKTSIPPGGPRVECLACKGRGFHGEPPQVYYAWRERLGRHMQAFFQEMRRKPDGPGAPAPALTGEILGPQPDATGDPRPLAARVVPIHVAGQRLLPTRAVGHC